MSFITMETVRKIWSSDAVEEHYEVGPDRHGMGLVDIRYYMPDGQLSAMQLSFPPDLAKLVARAMLACADELLDEPGATERSSRWNR